jgi:hypothetical protein
LGRAINLGSGRAAASLTALAGFTSLARGILRPSARIRRAEAKLVSAFELEVQIGGHPPGATFLPDTHGGCQARRDVPDSRLDTRVEMPIVRPQTSLSDREGRVAHLDVWHYAGGPFVGPRSRTSMRPRIAVSYSLMSAFRSGRRITRVSGWQAGCAL